MNRSIRLKDQFKAKALFPLFAAVIAADPAVPTFAQPRPAAPVAKAAKAGIDSLDDDKVADELASRGMDSLLQFYFQKNNVPPEKQQEKMVLTALRSINEPTFNTLPGAVRRKKIDDVVVGIQKMLPQIKDPNTLLKYASLLLVNGVDPLVNVLEYWGENPKSQASLNPVAEVVDKILAQAADIAKAQADALLATIRDANDPRIPNWEKINGVWTRAVYYRAMSAFGLAISYDQAAVAKRDKVCKDAITVLTDYLDPSSGVQIPAEVAIAKLNMIDGKFAEAHKHFDVVIKAPVTDDPRLPNKYIADQYQARYFDLVTDILEKKPEVAEKELPALLDWQREKLPQDFQLGAEAANSMLQYRVLATKADLTQDKAVKQKANDQAVAILMELVTKRPELRGIIFEQVMSKLPDKPVMAQLDPLLLEAIVTRGIQAVHHKPAEKEDPHNLDLASDAARELVKRKGQPGIGPEQVDRAAFQVGVFEERLGSEPSMAKDAKKNKLEAVEGYLDYVEKFGGNKTWAEGALDNAVALILPMYRADPSDGSTSAAYDRTLATALAHGRTAAAWPYANRLKDRQQFDQARLIFAKVSGTPSVNIFARYYQMYCDRQLLSQADKTPAGAPKVDPAVLSAEIQQLADQLYPLIESSLPKVDAKEQAKFRLVRARTTFLAADTARANNKPERVVELLKNFETQLSDVPPEMQNELLGNALFLRVNALISLNRNAEAIAAVQQLVDKQPQESLSIISQLLKTLNESFLQEKGKASPNMDGLRLLATQQAQISALLLQQIDKDPKNPNRPGFLAFNADAQMTAAQLSTDAKQKSTFLDAATATYQELLKQTQDESTQSGLERKIAIAQFLRGDEKGMTSAHETLSRLFAENKFGSPYERVSGSEDSMPNEMFWQGLYYLLRSQVELAKLHNDKPMREEAEQILKRMYIQFGDEMGGKGSRNDLQKLRNEIIPGWKPTTAPTSQRAVDADLGGGGGAGVGIGDAEGATKKPQ